MTEHKLLRSTAEIARYLRCHPSTVSRKIRSGVIPAFPWTRPGGGMVWVSSTSMIDAMITAGWKIALDREAEKVREMSDAELAERTEILRREVHRRAKGYDRRVD